MRAILYITYDGVLEPLGQSQVLEYLEKLCCDNKIHLLSFEKDSDRFDGDRFENMRSRLAKNRIEWTPLRYHKTPTVSATAFDIAAGCLRAALIVRNENTDIIHARSYVPALIGTIVKQLGRRPKMLFDMRGFWVDERVDGGIWPPAGWLYRFAKRIEKTLISNADHIVTLSDKSISYLVNMGRNGKVTPPITKIPTCANFALFKPIAQHPEGRFVFGYVGSVGTWYKFKETIEFFKAIRSFQPDAHFLIINRRDHDVITQILRDSELPPDSWELASADFAEVPGYLARMHAASALILPLFSKVACAPTKLAEYLGCGVLCVGNVGVGDVEDVLKTNRVGVTLSDFDQEEIWAKAQELLQLAGEPNIRSRCTETAVRLFSLENGVANYKTIYEQLKR